MEFDWPASAMVMKSTVFRLCGDIVGLVCGGGGCRGCNVIGFYVNV